MSVLEHDQLPSSKGQRGGSARRQGRTARA
jgi:hypothetical protein